jgi:hypothetical protein
MIDDQEHKARRFYFRRDQFAVVVLAFAMTAAIIFVLGILNGKEVPGMKPVNERSPAKTTATPGETLGSALQAEPQESLPSYSYLANESGLAPATKASLPESKPREKTAKVENPEPNGLAKAHKEHAAALLPQTSEPAGERAVSNSRDIEETSDR